jgi:hypothetical protein
MKNPATRRIYFQDKFKKASSNNATDKPFIFEENETLLCTLDMRPTQSVMRKSDPDSLVLSYTKTIMPSWS